MALISLNSDNTFDFSLERDHLPLPGPAAPRPAA